MLMVKTYRRSKTMDVVNAVKMIILVWTFASVCEASDGSCPFIARCPDVTGTVHEELTLTCSISLSCTKEADQCCIKSYMFKDENTTVIYTKEFPSETCEREINAKCIYNPSENMTAKFTLFSQTSCGIMTTEFIVNITESGGDQTVITDTVKKGEAKLTTSVVTVTVFAIISFIVIMVIIYRKNNPTNPCRLQRDYKTADSATKDDDNSK